MIELNVAGKCSAMPVVWMSRVVLLIYGALMLAGYWSELRDLDTTIRLVGSDVGCSLSAIDRNWLNFALEKAVGLAVMVTAIGAQFATGWRVRNCVQTGAAVVAVTHLVPLWMLLNPS